MANVIIPNEHKADFKPTNYRHEVHNPCGLILPKTKVENEQEVLAKRAIATLTKHYFGYKWGVEFTGASEVHGMGMLVIRLMDIPTSVTYVIQYKDLDIGMHAVRNGGAIFLEALGLPATKANGDKFRDIKQTPKGTLAVDPAAMPETNGGYRQNKQEFDAFIRK
jgi:hypothetical protein